MSMPASPRRAARNLRSGPFEHTTPDPRTVIRTCLFLLLSGLPLAAHAQALGGAAVQEGVAAPEAAAALLRAQGGAALQAPATPARPIYAEQLREPASLERPDGLEPFGANLFGGGFSNDREDGLNPNYVIQPGDSVSVRIWGATQFNQSVTVDPQGNAFVPGVGPIALRGTRNSDLNARVAQAVARVYTDNVRVYTSLDGSQPVAVFVTGFVTSPGRFAGIPSNSVLHFLDRAGGIDPQRGSYRDIRVVRDGETLARVDLYEFLVDGRLESVQFRDGDTLVVGPRGATVAVSGDVANEALFELEGESVDGRALAERAMLDPGVSHAGVSGVRGTRPFSIYVPIDQLDALELADGDEVSFRIDLRDSIIVVEVEGAHLGPSRFAVPRDTRLRELLDHIAVDADLADLDSISLKRETIAMRQKVALRASLERLEARYLTASSQTDAESAIRAQEAELIARFVDNAREVEPNGRLVVARGGEVADVLLQSGDTVTVPSKSESVLLSGEVLVSQAMLYERGLDARDYIQRSGGFGEQADTSRIVVSHLNGEVSTGKNPKVRPGDEIIVLPKVPSKNLQLAATIVDIVYKIAVAAAVAISL